MKKSDKHHARWEKVELQEICDLKAGKFINAMDILSKNDGSLYPCYGGNGLRGFVQRYSHKGVFPLIGRQGALCGNVRKGTGKFYATEHAIVVTPIENADEVWLYYQLIYTNLNKYATGVAQPGLSVKNIKEVYIPLPTLPEQKKIAEILSTWDQAIEKLEKLIELKEKRKKGLMQQLLVGKKRLPGYSEKWEEFQLEDVIESKSRPVPKPDKPYLSLGVRSHCKGLFHKPNFEPNKIAMDTLYKVKTNDLIINITFAWEGAVAIANPRDNDGLVSHRFPAFTCKENINISYLRYWILLPEFRFKLGLISPGGAGRNRVLNKKDLMKLKIFLPIIEEQKKIGTLLGNADKELSTFRKYLYSYKEQKKGLMQKLLTGEVRVKL